MIINNQSEFKNELDFPQKSPQIAELISLINKVNLKSPEAKANIMSISDNNGKRIFL